MAQNRKPCLNWLFLLELYRDHPNANGTSTRECKPGILLTYGKTEEAARRRLMKECLDQGWMVRKATLDYTSPIV